MKIIADRTQLSNCLQKIQYILEKSSSLNNSENILIETRERQLFIIAFDQNCSARATLACEIEEGGTISLNGRKLYDLVRSFKGNDVTIAQESGSTLLNISDSRSSFKIISADIDEFPEINFKIPEKSIVINSDDLTQLIDLTIFSVARISDPRYNLQGVFLELEKINGLLDDEETTMENREITHGSHYFSLVATDGHRVAVARCDQISGMIDLGERKIFSRKSLQEIKSIFNVAQSLNLGFADGELVVWSSSFVMILRMLQGDFPDYRKMIPERFKHSLELDRDSLTAVLKQMNLLSQEHYKGVIFKISESGLEISIDNPEMGHGNTDLTVEFQGEPLEISFNIDYLLDFLQAVPDERVVLKINDNRQPCLIRGYVNEEYMCGIMPIS